MRQDADVSESQVWSNLAACPPSCPGVAREAELLERRRGSALQDLGWSQRNRYTPMNAMTRMMAVTHQIGLMPEGRTPEPNSRLIKAS